MIHNQSETDDERRRIQWRQDSICATDRSGDQPLSQEKLYDVVVACGAPAALSWATLRKLRQGATVDTQRYKAVDFFWQSFDLNQSDKMGSLLAGNTSTGKTTLAVAALRFAALKGYTIRFISYEDFVQMHRDEMNLSMNASKYEDYAYRMDAIQFELWRWREVYEVLVIDDIFRTDQPAIFREKMHELIRSRFDHNSFTIVTTNLTAETLRSIDTRLFDFMFREYARFTFGQDDNVVPVIGGKG